MALPFFAITLFVSAFLLFLVQPMIGKLILPRLGGTPQVWNTCMMFFQTTLLAGYAYTHTLTSKLPTRRQLVVHCVMLLLPLLVLLPFGPFGFLRTFIPPPGRNPIFDTLLALTIAVGIPFLVVSTTAPLLQRWFVHTGHPAAKDPYFLYGASNLGSLLALFAYPALVEPLLGLNEQTWLWAGAYFALALLVGGCVVMVLKAPASVQLALPSLPEPLPAEAPPNNPEPVTQVKAAAPPRAATSIRRGSKQRGRQAPTRPAAGPSAPATPVLPAAPPKPYELNWFRRLRWVMLAAVPSSLMLGVTTYISTDISAIVMFWVIPLALYLLSFILVFLRWPVVWTDVPHTIIGWLQPLAILLLVWLLIARQGFNPGPSIAICMVAFFATALYCHGELARERPPTRFLTEFYLWMSVGGALGGIFNGLLAPVLFVGLLELPLAIVLGGLVRSRIMRVEPWTDSLVASALPGLADWLGDKGDEIARSYQAKPSAAAADTAPTPAAAPARLSRADLPPRGWLLHYSLDILLPILLAVVFWVWIRVTGGWLEALYNFWYKTMALERDSAVFFARKTNEFLQYGIPLLICFLYCPRPLRFGLGIGAVLLVNTIYESSQDTTVVYATRSYFGILRVREQSVHFKEGGGVAQNYTYLMHGTTYHGMNFQTPKVLRRVATTYYHRFGPVGDVMEKINWFPMPRAEYTLDPETTKRLKFNPFSADARLPVSLIGSASQPMAGALRSPLAVMPTIVSAWSEPPYATIGLGTGTMASYCRPFQHLTFYEIDNTIRSFSEKDFTWPDGRVAPFFNYVMDARKRGGYVDIIMGDARLSMKQEDPTLTTRFARRDHYYRAMVVDAFSSDAIPVHLITEEAIAMYMSKLMLPRDETVKDKDGKEVCKHFSGGVLCVHTSNRHVDLVKPVTDIAKKLGLAWRVGHDQGDRGQDRLPVSLSSPDIGRFSAEYVMLAKTEEDLPPDTPEEDVLAHRRGQEGAPRLIWYTPRAPGNRIWTDNFSNLLGVFRW